jgi:hypothetical protein
MPSVFNKHHGDAPPAAVYIGRPSKWGNPFVVGRDGARGECVARYEGWVESNKELQAQLKSELRGKDLVCFCKPRPCHGDVLLRIANSD